MSNMDRRSWKRRHYIAALCCLLLILSGCASLFSGVSGNGNTTAPVVTVTGLTAVTGASPTPVSDSDLASKLVQGMTLDEKLGQMVIVEFYGSTLNADLIHMISINRVSGVLIENKNGNAQTRQQLVTLNQAMQGQTHIPLFITTDYEGGIVNELRQITGERPSDASIGATHDPRVAYNAGFNAAKDLAALGLNVNFMPIVDVLTNPNNPGLPMRTFGSDPKLVTDMGRAYLKGLTDGGVVGCLKHFPGLGSASIDPCSLPQAAMLAVNAGTDLILGPRGLQDTVTMLTNLKQDVTSGQISMNRINASVQRILEMKLHYKIMTHDKAQQLIDNGEAVSHEGTCVGGCVALSSVKGVGDGDVRRQVV